jgi:hypothetical protein
MQPHTAIVGPVDTKKGHTTPAIRRLSSIAGERSQWGHLHDPERAWARVLASVLIPLDRQESISGPLPALPSRIASYPSPSFQFASHRSDRIPS